MKVEVACPFECESDKTFTESAEVKDHLEKECSKVQRNCFYCSSSVEAESDHECTMEDLKEEITKRDDRRKQQEESVVAI